MSKELALTKDGKLSQCSVPAELRGQVKGCPHIAHEYDWETREQTISRFEDLQKPENTNFNNDAINKEYNRKAYWETKEQLEKYGKCCIVQGTSTGKSSIFCRLLEDYPNKKILTLTPNTDQKKQLRDDYKIKGDVATYSAFCGQPQSELNKYDLIVLDECHHVGREDNVCAQKVEEMLKYNKDLLIIGATATPLRTDKLNPIDTIFDGHSSSNLDTTEVFEAGYLRKPRIVQLENLDKYKKSIQEMVSNRKSNLHKYGTDLKDSFQKIYDELNKDKNDSIVEDELAEKIRLNIKNGEPSKMIIFCNDAGEGMDKLKMKYDPIIQKACERNRIQMESSKYANSNGFSMSPKEKTKIFKRFKEEDNKVEVVYVYKMLGEGVHMKGVNMAMNFREGDSATDPTQQIGRILDSPKKQKSDPLYIDFSGEFDERIPYSECLTNRRQAENYGKVEALHRHIEKYNTDTIIYKGKERDITEVIKVMANEYGYNFSPKNHSQIREWIKYDKMTPKEIMDRRKHLIDAYPPETKKQKVST